MGNSHDNSSVPAPPARWRQAAASVRPMLATLADAPLDSPSLLYEPKYDGIRGLVEVKPATGGAEVRIWSRLGNEKTTQFPSIVTALQKAASRLRVPLLLDGEIVALDDKGQPAGFQRLQGRIHLIEEADVARSESSQPVALILFDILRDGDDDLRGLPLTERRARLEARFASRVSETIRLSEQVRGEGVAMQARAEAEHWEGLIAKDATAPYHSGKRSPAWRKLKILQSQELVIGGWTEPRQTRQYFGALLLGVYETVDSRVTTDPRLTTDSRLPTADSRLLYVGHTGTGFNGAELARVAKLLKAREIKNSPFTSKIVTNERAHWVRPELVAQVRFTEWTADNKLRHPVYLGLREDKDPRTVVREGPVRSPMPARDPKAPPAARRAAPRRTRSASAADKPAAPKQRVPADLQKVIAQLRVLEDTRKDGAIELPDGSRLSVTNLAKPFWPKLKLTKGDLLRYYATVAPLVLPAVADRPLVMKRFPNGVDGMAFYQQRQREEKPPAGVRIETLEEHEPASEPDMRRLIGGSLITLLYMTQIAAISQDPWFSRVQSPLDADYVALDLDPDDHTPFSRVLDVARWIRDELASLEGALGAEDVGVVGAAHLHPPAAGHVIRIGHALLPDRRDGGGLAPPEGSHHRAQGQGAPARHGLRRLPAEHSGQDAGDRV